MLGKGWWLQGDFCKVRWTECLRSRLLGLLLFMLNATGVSERQGPKINYKSIIA